MKKIIKLVKIIISISAIAGIIAFIAERLKDKFSNHKPYGIYEEYIKRPLDCFLATGALIVLSPVLLIVALLVRINLGSPVIFTQERPGKDKKIFRMYKFRTMTDERDSNGELLPDEYRLTPFGKWLRSTSLDELPELINIVKGDMAIVGPRPLAVQYLPYYNDEEKHRHDVMPGLTGYAQVKGRNSLEWEEKFSYDLEYIDSICFMRDFRIVLDTINVCIRKDDIGERGVGTSVDFDEWRRGDKG